MATTEMNCLAGGGGENIGTPIYVDIEHKARDATTVYITITVDGTDLVDTSFSATSYGGIFDQTFTFSVSGNSCSLRVHSERYTQPCILYEFTCGNTTLEGAFGIFPASGWSLAEIYSMQSGILFSTSGDTTLNGFARFSM